MVNLGILAIGLALVLATPSHAFAGAESRLLNPLLGRILSETPEGLAISSRLLGRRLGPVTPQDLQLINRMLVHEELSGLRTELNARARTVAAGLGQETGASTTALRQGVSVPFGHRLESGRLVFLNPVGGAGKIDFIGRSFGLNYASRLRESFLASDSFLTLLAEGKGPLQMSQETYSTIESMISARAAKGQFGYLSDTAGIVHVLKKDPLVTARLSPDQILALSREVVLYEPYSRPVAETFKRYAAALGESRNFGTMPSTAYALHQIKARSHSKTVSEPLIAEARKVMKGDPFLAAVADDSRVSELLRALPKWNSDAHLDPVIERFVRSVRPEFYTRAEGLVVRAHPILESVSPGTLQSIAARRSPPWPRNIEDEIIGILGADDFLGSNLRRGELQKLAKEILYGHNDREAATIMAEFLAVRAYPGVR